MSTYPEKRVFPEKVNQDLKARLAFARVVLKDIATPRVLRAIRADFLEETADELGVTTEAIRKRLDPTP